MRTFSRHSVRSVLIGNLSYFLLFLIILIHQGCQNKVVPFINNYQEKGYQVVTTQNKTQVWDKLVSIITDKGLGIKVIDFNTGLITTENTSFLTSYAFEDKDGNLTNEKAEVVCAKLRGPLTFGTSIKPDSISGQWTFIATEKNGGTIIEIKLTNAEGKVTINEVSSFGEDQVSETHQLQVRSTGQFEKSIEQAFL